MTGSGMDTAAQPAAGRSDGRQHGMADRFVLFSDRDGRRHAVTRTAVAALCEGEDGITTLLLPGGRVILVEQPLEAVVAMLLLP